MRRIVTVLLSTLTVVVLLLSYRTSTDSTMASDTVQQTPQPSAASPDPSTSSATPSAAPSSPAATSPSSKSSPSSTTTTTKAPSSTPSRSSTSSAASSRTYAGTVAQTRWGPVQVQVTVRAGKVTAAKALEYPQGNGRDAEINAYALPILDQEVVQQQSASIDTVSGATVTSDGYVESLQSAIDRAHI